MTVYSIFVLLDALLQASKGDVFLTGKNSLQYGLKSVRFAGAKLWNNVIT